MKALALRVSILVFTFSLAGAAQAAIFIPGPPIPRVAIRVSPGPDWFWVGGRWERRINTRVWRGERFLPPAHFGRVWIGGGWHERRWVGGHWR